LAHQVEGNLLAANQEVQKLGLLYPQGELSDATVREAVLNVSRYDAFQLGEAVLAGMRQELCAYCKVYKMKAKML